MIVREREELEGNKEIRRERGGNADQQLGGIWRK